MTERLQSSGVPQHVAPGVPQAGGSCQPAGGTGAVNPVRRSTPRPLRQALPLTELR